MHKEKVKKKILCKKNIKYWYLKKYTPEILIEILKNTVFPDYYTFNNVDKGYSDLIQKVNSIIDKIAPVKEICVKNNTEEWVNEETFEAIRVRDKNTNALNEQDNMSII